MTRADLGRSRASCRRLITAQEELDQRVLRSDGIDRPTIRRLRGRHCGLGRVNRGGGRHVELGSVLKCRNTGPREEHVEEKATLVGRGCTTHELTHVQEVAGCDR